jgi:hypothetical protein
MTEARTVHANYLFKAKEYADGSPWIFAEPRHKDILVLEHGFLGFSLRSGTTMKQAENIAEFMNANLDDVSITLFAAHPMFRNK